MARSRSRDAALATGALALVLCALWSRTGRRTPELAPGPDSIAAPSPQTAALAPLSPRAPSATAAVGAANSGNSPANNASPATPFVPHPPVGALDPALRAGDTVEGAAAPALRLAAARRDAENARFYRNMAEYPAWTQPLPPGRDPVLESARPRTAGAASTDGQQLQVTFNEWALTPGRELVVTARLTSPSGAAQLSSVRARLLDTHRAEMLANIVFTAQDDGAMVGRWTVPDAAMVATDPGLHSLEVMAVTSTGQALNATTVLNLAASSVTLLHRYRDALENGSLVLYALVRCEAETRVHLSGTLARVGALDGARLYAQSATVVPAGEQWVPLRFYGRGMRGLGDGPYTLTALQVQDTSQFPPARLPLERDAWRTQPYEASAFSNDPYNDPVLTDLAAFSEGRTP